jgi:hypothetical protein
MSSFADPDFPNNLLTSIQDTLISALNDFQTTLSSPKIRNWLRLFVIVAGYIMLRPLIEMFFRKIFDRKMAREEAKKKEQEEKDDAALLEQGASKKNIKKAKRAANALRSADGGSVGKVSGGVGDSDDEEELNKGKATGVSSDGGISKNARRRQKQHLKNLEKQEAEQKGNTEMTEEELLDLLDWSESENEETEEQ